MKCLTRVAILILMMAIGKGVSAQVDPHFSQYYVYPSWLNPALTGIFDGDYRVSGIYRTQWGTIAAFNTPGATAEITTNKNVNFGVSVMNQTVKDAGYNYLTAYGSASYTGVRFGQNGDQRLVFGIQAGIINRRFDQSKITTGNQWNPVTGFDHSISAEQLAVNKAATFDAGAGLLYFDAAPGKKLNFYGGFAASHLTQPDDKFTAATVTKKMPMRFTWHAGAKINVNENLSITPNALYLMQGNASEKMIGAYFSMKAGEVTDFLFGANYRFDDAIVPYVGFNYKNFTLGASYDHNISDLGRMVGGVNSFEISLSYIGKKGVKIDRSHFVCPSL